MRRHTLAERRGTIALLTISIAIMIWLIVYCGKNRSINQIAAPLPDSVVEQVKSADTVSINIKPKRRKNTAKGAKGTRRVKVNPSQPMPRDFRGEEVNEL